MILSIAQYAEALLNPAGRFQTLSDLVPMRDAEGKLAFRIHNQNFVSFRVTIGNRPCQLLCPLHYDAETALRMERMCRSTACCDSKWFHAPKFLDEEVILFDASDRDFRVSLILQSLHTGEKLDDFLKRATLAAEKRPLQELLAAFVEMALWIRSQHFGIKQHNIVVAPDRKLYLNGVGGEDRSPEIAFALFLAVVQPTCYPEIARPLLLRQIPYLRIVDTICRQATATGFNLPEILFHREQTTEVDRALEQLVNASAKDPLIDFEALRSLSSSKTARANEPVIRPIPFRERFPGHLQVDEPSDGIIRVYDPQGWHFVDCENRPLFEGCFRHAMPFHEGRAEVETESGAGLIDKEGRFILPPVYEEVCWDDYNNRIYVEEQGKWSMLYRDGSPVNQETFDWMGECCEGLILVMRNRKHGFITLDGKIAIPLQYDDASSFSEGVAEVMLNGERFCIDHNGEKV